MCVPRGEIGVTRAGPVFEPDTDCLAPLVVFGGTGRVFETCQLQRFPKIAHQPAGKFPKLIVPRVNLMPVQQMYPPPAGRVFENQAFRGTRQETIGSTGRRAEFHAAFDAVVIAPKQEETLLCGEIRQLGEYVTVDFGNVCDIAVFS